MTSVPSWPRPFFHKFDCSAGLAVLALTDRELEGPVGADAEEGWPDDYEPEGMEVVSFDLQDLEDRATYGDALSALRGNANRLPPLTTARLDSVRFGLSIGGELGDRGDLAHLQAVQASLRWLARNAGCFAAVNLMSEEWIDVAALLASPPSPTFVLGEWVGFVMPVDPAPRFGRVLHSRGMGQFGRPEVMMIGFDDALLDQAAAALWVAANDLAKGAVVSEGSRYLVARGVSTNSVEARVHALRPGENGPDCDLESALILSVPDEALRRMPMTAVDTGDAKTALG